MALKREVHLMSGPKQIKATIKVFDSGELKASAILKTWDNDSKGKVSAKKYIAQIVEVTNYKVVGKV